MRRAAVATTTTEPSGDVADPAPRPTDPRRPSRWLIPAALTAIAAALRLHRLDVPPRIYFDETYYVSDALSLLTLGVEDGFAVHPPLGKWLIGLGVGLLGNDPAGWRSAVAMAGALTVLVTYLAAVRLLRRRGVAALAALLVAIDGLALSMSRIAMLDGFVALGAVTAFWLLLVDRDRLWQGAPAQPAEPPSGRRSHLAPPPRPRWARWLAALVLGATIAVKWSGVLALAGAIGLVVVSELLWRRRTVGHALVGWPRLAGHLALAFVLLPAAVYVLSYAGWFLNYEQTRLGSERCPEDGPCPVTLPERIGDWVGEQAAIWRFHQRLDAGHPYRSTAGGWPLLHRPVTYAYDSCTPQARAELAAEGEECVVADGHVRHVIGLGNPVLWWVALPGYALLGFAAVRWRDWRAAAILGFAAVQYLPWLALTRPAFLFYMTPVVPFMALTVAYMAWCCQRVRSLRWWLPSLLAAIAVAAFVYWYPVLAGVELPEEAWRQRMWLSGWI